MEHSRHSPREAHRATSSPRSAGAALLGGYFLLLAGIVWFIKSSYLPALWLDPVFGLYGLVRDGLPALALQPLAALPARSGAGPTSCRPWRS